MNIQELIAENEELKRRVELLSPPQDGLQRFIYLVAYFPKEDPDVLAFHHEVIHATDIDDAYSVGMDEVDDEVMKLGKLVNNLVIQL